jgi:hypothetical protein
MTESRPAGQADLARPYLGLTALEGPAEDAGKTPEIALRKLRQEYVAVLKVDGTPATGPADHLLRHEVHNGPPVARRPLRGPPAGRQGAAPGRVAVSVVRDRHVWKVTRHVGGCGGFRARGADL